MKKKLKEVLNWTSFAETNYTGLTDAKPSVHPMVIGYTGAQSSAQYGCADGIK